MTKKEKAAFVAQTLHKLYPHPAIPLDHRDAYTLLVAVVLSAATGEIGGHGSKLAVLKDRSVQRWGAPPVVIAGVLEEECRAL